MKWPQGQNLCDRELFFFERKMSSWDFFYYYYCKGASSPMGNIELRVQDATVLESENDDKLNNRDIKTRLITVTKKQAIVRPSAEKK